MQKKIFSKEKEVHYVLSRKLAPKDFSWSFRFRRTPPEEGMGASLDGFRDPFLGLFSR